MKYKAGDKVRIQPYEWYLKEIESESWCPNIFDIYWCSREMTISKIEKSYYLMEEDMQEFHWTDEMIEGLVEDEMSLDKAGQITDFEYEGLAYTLPDGYIFKDENGNVINATKIVLEKKKKEYPKTYEECCEIYSCSYNVQYDRCETAYESHLHNKLFALRKLIICRDAYWTLYGEEMGLEMPWEPDWLDDDVIKYIISHDGKRFGTRGGLNYINYILAFPTEEMRDYFYECFKDLIEICKELL